MKQYVKRFVIFMNTPSGRDEHYKVLPQGYTLKNALYEFKHYEPFRMGESYSYYHLCELGCIVKDIFGNIEVCRKSEDVKACLELGFETFNMYRILAEKGQREIIHLN